MENVNHFSTHLFHFPLNILHFTFSLLSSYLSQNTIPKNRHMQKINLMLACLLVSGSLLSQVSLKSTDLLPLDPKVRTGVLPNGMKYYIKHNAKPEKRAELRLAVNAGSTMENDDQQGLAHFVEHMAFNGSKNFKKK